MKETSQISNLDELSRYICHGSCGHDQRHKLTDWLKLVFHEYGQRATKLSNWLVFNRISAGKRVSIGKFNSPPLTIFKENKINKPTFL